jgi:uncharacterized membrane protein
VRRIVFADDRGSTIPLILGFYLIAALVVGGGVAASDAFTKQRELQSICDGAALAASSAIDGHAARTQDLNVSLPLVDVQDAVDVYLARDRGRGGVVASAQLDRNGAAVRVECARQVRVAFGQLIGRSRGVRERASAAAEGRVQ